MIGSLRGVLTAKRAPQIIIECHGVGYQVETPMSTFLELPLIGKEVFLYTHLQVREDAQTLYGFASEEEKTLFRTLLKVSGVGAKMALSVLTAMSVGDFERCVRHEDTAMLIKIPGVGRKTAERLIIEMRDRIEKGTAIGSSRPASTADDPRSEAVDALIALGYKPPEVKRLLSQLDTDGKSSADIIRLALKQAVN
ncbi:MAG: Holliday junction branch migration protein RuvA [Gammaproteobacteria bacterium]|nr:Holliday junction branch migration protein RuvA [Gammaproteobacteria bacterium]MDH4313926.1 Holliday junction branch migration protein RuvA [Gammaproteobacteria bacterium]MDH5212998.1 Holliday junction branch migration protein RuvA [Gammaproteobacteria bacterium]